MVAAFGLDCLRSFLSLYPWQDFLFGLSDFLHIISFTGVRAAMPGDPSAWYPIRRAPECAVPKLPLMETLLRLVPGDSRGRKFPVIFRNFGRIRDAWRDELSSVILQITAVPTGPTVTVCLGVGGKVRPDVWLDFLQENIIDFEFAITVYASQGEEHGCKDIKGDSVGIDLTNAILIGRGHLLSEDFTGLRGVISRPIISPKHACIGEFVFEYLIIKPFGCMLSSGKRTANCKPSMETPFSYETSTTASFGFTDNEIAKRTNNVPSFAGHRGLGENKTTFVQENTLLSFALATRNANVRHVELDVQLTKDGIPIVYHNWFHPVPRQTRNSVEVRRVNGRILDGAGDGFDFHRLFLYDLTAEEFCSLLPPSKSFQSHLPKRTGSMEQAELQSWSSGYSSSSSSVQGYDSDGEGRHPILRRAGQGKSNLLRSSRSVSSEENFDTSFPQKASSNAMLSHRLPTLKTVCTQLPSDVGLLVEIKYPPPNVQAKLGIPYPERNFFVDSILHSLMCDIDDNFRSRSIILMSFDADICAMLALKQTRYYVYFQNCEQRDGPEECDDADPRTISCANGIDFATSQRLQGLVLFAEMVLENDDLARRIVEEKNLVLMTYGSENRDPNLILRQYDLGVHGVIADDVVKVSSAVARQVEYNLGCRNEDFSPIDSMASL